MSFDSFNPSMITSIAGIATQAGGSLISAYGAKAAAVGQQGSLSYQAAISDFNANLAERAAQQELLKGQRQVGAVTLRAGKIKSMQRASFAANGVDLGVDSPAEVLASTDLMKEIDKATVEANAISAAWGNRLQGANYKAAAIMQRAGASVVSPDSAFGSTLLAGGSKVAESWYKFSKEYSTTKSSDDPIYDLGTSRGWW